MAAAQHPAASHHLPWFITAPENSDVLFVFTTIMVIGAGLGLGVLFFRLHSLPERLGHKKLQFEIVAVLGLLSLFTHVHAFWVAGLLLAVIDLPDFLTPLRRIATSTEKLSGTERQPDMDSEPERPPPREPEQPQSALPEPAPLRPAQLHPEAGH
jgi:hypothetical protein